MSKAPEDPSDLLQDIENILGGIQAEITALFGLEPTPSDMPAHAEPATFVDAGPVEPWLIQGKRDLRRHFGCRTH